MDPLSQVPKDPRERHLQAINSTMLAIEVAHDSAVRARKRLVEDDAEPNLIRALDTAITTLLAARRQLHQDGNLAPDQQILA